MKKKVWLPTIIMFFFGVLFLMPIILLVMNAFKTHNDMIQNFLSFPHYLYTGNFTEAIERLKFWRVVGNSAYVTLGTMLVCTIISFMAAYGIAHIPGKLGTVLYLMFTLGQIIPFHSIMIALSVQLTNANLLNNLTVLIFLYAGFHGAFGIFTYVGFLKSIPKELEEAAAIDGCSRWKAVWNITIPGIASTIVVLSILGLGNVLNAGFDQIFNLYSPLVYSTGDILDTWVYRMGLLNVQFSLATAAGLFKSVISFTLIVISYIIAYKAADYKIF